jgi:O-antigen/teichoic acid export membrane protein
VKRVVLDTLSLLARHFLGLLVGVLTVGLVARQLGAPGLGAWSLLGVVAFLVGLCDLGLSVGVGRAIVAGSPPRAIAAVERSFLVILLLAPFLGGGAVLWALHELTRLGAPLPPERLLVVGALVWLGGLAGALAMPLRALLVSVGSIAPTSVARSMGAAVQALLLLVGFRWFRGLEVPTAAFAAGAWIELWALGKRAREHEPSLRLLPSLGAARGLPGALREGLAMLVINVAVVIALRVDAAILTAVASLGAIAAYGVAARAVDQVFGLVKQVSVALQPRMATRQGREEVLRLGAWVQPPLVIGAMAALWFSGEPLLRLWVGPVLDDGAFRVALGFLGAAAVLAAFSEVANAWLALAATSPWVSAFAIGLGCLVNLTVSLAGRSSWGVAAVAAGTLLGNLISSSVAWVIAARASRWRLRQLLAAFAPAVASAVAVLLVGPWSSHLAARGPLMAFLGCCLVGLSALLAAAAVAWPLVPAPAPACPEVPCTSESLPPSRAFRAASSACPSRWRGGCGREGTGSSCCPEGALGPTRPASAPPLILPSRGAPRRSSWPRRSSTPRPSPPSAPRPSSSPLTITTIPAPAPTATSRPPTSLATGPPARPASSTAAPSSVAASTASPSPW